MSSDTRTGTNNKDDGRRRCWGRGKKTHNLMEWAIPTSGVRPLSCGATGARWAIVHEGVGGRTGAQAGRSATGLRRWCDKMR